MVDKNVHRNCTSFLFIRRKAMTLETVNAFTLETKNRIKGN